MGFLSKLKLAHQLTSALTKATLDRDDAVKVAAGFRATLAKLEGMEVEMSREACNDKNLNPILSTEDRRKLQGYCRRLRDRCRGFSGFNKCHRCPDEDPNMQMVEQTAQASAIARSLAQTAHAEGANLLEALSN